MAIPVPSPRVAKFEKQAFGMFIHWGLYSQLGQGEWVQHLRKIPMDEYAALKDTFTAGDFDARQIAKTAKRAGMNYIVLTTRHHDGFSLYDTRGLSDYDAPHSAAKRDLIAEFVQGCRQEGITPFFYHTTLDWYQPSFNDDFDSYLEYLLASVEVLCTHYGPIGGFWFDGNWSKPDADWKLDELYGTIRRLQPEAMIINNTGLDLRGEIGHPEVDSVTFEQGRPEPMNREGMSKYVSAEMCQTINGHWGFGRQDFSNKSTGELIANLLACRKVGANYLLNVGPQAGGSISKLQEATLEVIGDWISMHGNLVYEGKPGLIKGQGHDFALETDDGTTYLFVHDLTIDGHANVTTTVGGTGPRVFTNVTGQVSAVRWLDNGEELAFTHDAVSGLLCFHATGYPYGDNVVVRVAVIS
ncbi:alpha-L-fucosidase [Paenibacillus sp. BC26]|uniref:alpha-L-fucosidase n=1 Tax=Paenibacillus sp. BC26 TaxID=1881032 RepID=UPI0008E40A8C|nr:alpha-L-fucosidase [Paenibacillus sp. BC26]SFS46000.1 alpha-L-fucosidase [Paenibacillus sp. BC26]